MAQPASLVKTNINHQQNQKKQKYKIPMKINGKSDFMELYMMEIYLITSSSMSLFSDLWNVSVVVGCNW